MRAESWMQRQSLQDVGALCSCQGTVVTYPNRVQMCATPQFYTSVGGRQARHAGAVRRPRTSVYRWLYRFVGNETVAEDLLSDVFFDVWEQAGRFEGRSAVATWLLSIARFKALSARRRRTHAELDETIETTVADTADNAEVALEKKHQGEVLARRHDQAVMARRNEGCDDCVRRSFLQRQPQESTRS